MTRLGDAVNATKDMAEIGATGSTYIDGPNPFNTVSGSNPMEQVLPSQYLTNVQDWMFGDSDTTDSVKSKSMPRLLHPRRNLMSIHNVMATQPCRLTCESESRREC